MPSVGITAAPQLFISYASKDRPRAAMLAEALEGYGWSVWWDRHIPAGKVFARVIEKQLKAAKCVIVLWSKAAKKSDWVCAEAAEGMRRGILVPALIEDVRPPFGFGQFQAARLIGWKERTSSREFKDFLQGIENLIGRAQFGISRGTRTVGKMPSGPLFSKIEAQKPPLAKRTARRVRELGSVVVRRETFGNSDRSDHGIHENFYAPPQVLKREEAAYQRCHEEWDKKYEKGSFIAIHKGKVVADAKDNAVLLKKLIKLQPKFGRFRVYIVPIGHPLVIEIRGPRFRSRGRAKITSEIETEL